MKFGLREEIYDKIINITKKYDYKFLMFGSRARGDYKNNSDIDIAILGDVLSGDENKIRSEFDAIDMEYMVDLIFVNQITNAELIGNIQKEGVEIE